MRQQIQFRDADVPTADRLLADIEALAPGISDRAAEIEAERRIPTDIVRALKSIGVFRMFVPRSHGGLQFDLPTALDVIAALARIDGSLGWTVMIASGGSIAAPLLRREMYDRLYQSGPDAIMVGSAKPTGTAEPALGGWRVSGSWPFASFCQHADWLLGVCVMTEGGKPIPASADESGPPLVRGFCLPAHEWRIEDTWHVAGLKGTGSNHISLENVLVPAANFFDLTGTPCVSSPLSHALLQSLPLLHAASSVGMAEGTLADLVALANSGRKLLRAPSRLLESELFQSDLGRVAAQVRASRAFMRVQAESHWRHALAGTLQDDALMVEGTQTAVWIAATCAAAADTCFALAGSVAVYENSPLQRRLRDLHVAAQHGGVHPSLYVNAGQQMLGKSAAR